MPRCSTDNSKSRFSVIFYVLIDEIGHRRNIYEVFLSSLFQQSRSQLLGQDFPHTVDRLELISADLCSSRSALSSSLPYQSFFKVVGGKLHLVTPQTLAGWSDFCPLLLLPLLPLKGRTGMKPEVTDKV